MKFLFALLLVSSSPTNAFIPQTPHPLSQTRLHAANGAPQYDKFEAILRQAEEVGEGSVMLNIDTQDVVEYPGFVEG